MFICTKEVDIFTEENSVCLICVMFCGCVNLWIKNLEIRCIEFDIVNRVTPLVKFKMQFHTIKGAKN